jgi:hypothetical protein
MDGVTFVRDRAAFVHGIPGDVEHAAHDAVADRHGDGPAGVGHFIAALEAVGGGHGDGADPVVAEVLLDFEDESGRPWSGSSYSMVRAL